MTAVPPPPGSPGTPGTPPRPGTPLTPGTPRILPFGDRGILFEVDTLDEVLTLYARLAASRPAGVVDLVPAARTVLVHVDPPRLSLAAARAWVARAADAPAPARADAALVELPIVYDGPDLDELAETLGIPAADLAAQHAACEWTVAFTGFAPGFGYLVSPDWPHRVPRHPSPRTRVPAGAVGLAGEFAGAYPRETPGGWQLIGTTPASLFDPHRDPPALLAPGTRVRFVPAPAPDPSTAGLHLAAETLGSTPGLGRQMQSRGNGPALTVVEPGLLATVQDQGRAGHAAAGIARSGAADRAALRTANRLLGNPEDAAGIEITMGGFRARAETDLRVVVTGAWGPLQIAHRPADPYTVHDWPRGTELHVGWFDHGARAYLAVRGGVDAEVVAGSRSTDTLSGLGAGAGHGPLRAGDTLALADAHPAAPVPPDALHPWSPPGDAAITLELAPGPRADWVEGTAALFEQVWTVSNQADRVGIRLDGPHLETPPLARTRRDELPSEGMLPGAIQVPPDGRPVILGPDGPVTGGYPVIAVVTDASRDALAQARPGTRLRFRHAR